MSVLKVGAIGVGLLIGACIVIPILLNLVGLMHEYRIPSSAMEPTIHCGRSGIGLGCEAKTSDRIVTLRYVVTSPGRGDIVVFHAPRATETACGSGGIFVKRLVGMPGEHWAERRGYVYINGKRLSESYVKADRRDSMTYGPIQIPKGEYFTMGDNRAGSCDSRRWGTLPRGNIIGKMIATYWPPSRISIQ